MDTSDSHCIICTDEYTFQQPKYITQCNHHFHHSCLMMNYMVNGNQGLACPMCRTQLFPMLYIAQPPSPPPRPSLRKLKIKLFTKSLFISIFIILCIVWLSFISNIKMIVAGITIITCLFSRIIYYCCLYRAVRNTIAFAYPPNTSSSSFN